MQYTPSNRGRRDGCTVSITLAHSIFSLKTKVLVFIANIVHVIPSQIFVFGLQQTAHNQGNTSFSSSIKHD